MDLDPSGAFVPLMVVMNNSTDNSSPLPPSHAEATRSASAPSGNPKEDVKYRAVKLRQFLQHVLCCDYRIWDGHHPFNQFYGLEGGNAYYLQAASEINELRSFSGRRHGQAHLDRLHVTLQKTVAHKVRDPALNLGVPPDLAEEILLRYATHIDKYGRYTGCLHALLWADRSEVSRKIWVDQTAVIPAVIQSGEESLGRALRRAGDNFRRVHHIYHV